MVELKQPAVRLNIGLIITFLEKYGGAERYLIECLRFWQHRHDVTLYTTTLNRDLLAEYDIGPKVQLVALTPYFSDHAHSVFLNIALLPKIWREEIGQHDVYYSHLWPTHLIDLHPMVWCPQEPMRMLHDLRFDQTIESLKSENIRKIHIYPKYHYDSVDKNLFEASLNAINQIDKTGHPERIIANSRYSARYLEEVYQRPITDVVYPGVNQNLFADLPIDPNLFLTISQLWIFKRVQLLIEAVALTQHTKLVIVGSGPERENLLKLIQKLGLEGRVFIISGLNNQELSLLLSRACAFLFAAIREPFGIVILEAMAAGKPIIAVDQGGYTEICDDRFAFLVPPHPSAFAEKMTYLQQNPTIAQRMGVFGHKKSEEYRWERTVNQIETILIQTYLESVSTPLKSSIAKEASVLFGIQYFAWYGDGFGAAHWNDNPKSGRVSEIPILGYYSSAKGETIHAHLDLFEQMGLDFVILNLHVDQAGVNQLELMGIQHVFEIAQKRNSSLKFAIQLCPYVTDSVKDVMDIVKLISKDFKSHSHYFHLGGKPVLFWFWAGILDGNKTLISQLAQVSSSFSNIAASLRLFHPVDESKLTFDFFEGMVPFSPLELAAEENWHKIWTLAYQNAKSAGMQYRGVTLSPGYDDTFLDDEFRVGNPYRSMPRQEGKTYRACFDFVDQLIEKPDLVMISTFNEYHENSHIEPTTHHRNKYIDLSKEFIACLRNKWGK
ncbi:MAG TPA: glycosyltransferase [Chlamydiales bacterium]|nr:glycosyltransferase [Chlamydiales bacterium]